MHPSFDDCISNLSCSCCSSHLSRACHEHQSNFTINSTFCQNGLVGNYMEMETNQLVVRENHSLCSNTCAFKVVSLWVGRGCCSLNILVNANLNLNQSKQVDPDGGRIATKRCMHVNLVKSSNLGHEREFLFAPYSVFTVLSPAPNRPSSVGFVACPYIVGNCVFSNREQC